MNNKKTVIILIVVFALFIGGASLLYHTLGDQIQPQQLMTQSQPLTEAENQTDAENRRDEEGEGDEPVSEQPGESQNESQEDLQAEIPLAPDFTVYDMDGNAVNLSDFRGKPVVLNFWASWCGPCQSEMPDFDEAYAQYGEDIYFLMVNMTDGSRETVESASDFVTENGYSFPVFYDTDLSAAVAYGVYSLPASYFIDADGYAIARAIGAINAATLQQGIDMIFSEQ